MSERNIHHPRNPHNNPFPFPGNLKELERFAFQHCQARHQMVARVLNHVNRLALLDIKRSQPYGANAAWMVQKAYEQDRKSRSGASMPMQAAHLLPGQLYLRAPSGPLRLQEVAQVLGAMSAFCDLMRNFGKTTNLPRQFNVADSQAEEAGLTTTFEKAAREVWQKTYALAPEYHPTLIGVTLIQFMQDSRLNYLRGRDAKLNKMLASDRKKDQSTVDTREGEGLVLEAYARAAIQDMARAEQICLTEAKLLHVLYNTPHTGPCQL